MRDEKKTGYALLTRKCVKIFLEHGVQGIKDKLNEVLNHELP